MTPLSQATAAPVELKINGSVYLLKPLKEKDYGEVEQWLRSRAFAVARESIDGFTGEDRKIILEAAYAKASNVSMTSPEAVQILMSRDGIAKLLHLGLREHHPQLTVQEIGGWFTDPAVLDQVMSQFDDVNQLQRVPTGNDAPKKNPAEPQPTEPTSTATSPNGTDSAPVLSST